MKKYRVVLVDDEITIRDGFKHLFNWKEHGCEVVGEASDGIAAVNVIGQLNPDIVIIDINLPIMNGLDVVKLVQQTKQNVAFVIVSGYDDFSYCREALRLKIVDYILKPVCFEEFAEVIDRLRINLYRNNTEKSTLEMNNDDRKLIFSMTHYIQEHLDEEISLKKLSEEFHLSANYVSQVFKNEIGVNYYAYVTNLRIEQAKSLLITTQKPVSEIAELVGFSDYRVFTKAFKKNEKVPPSQFRKNFSSNFTMTVNL